MIYVNNDSEYVIFPNVHLLEVHRVRAKIVNNVTNTEVIGFGSNSSTNGFFLKFVFQSGWLEQFPDNEYTVYLEIPDDNDGYISIGSYLVSKGIVEKQEKTYYEKDTEYIQYNGTQNLDE